MKQKDVTITVIRNQNTFYIKCNETESLMEALIRQGVYFSADCGGNGTCGKCAIQVIEGELEVTVHDQTTYDTEKLQKGYRLSCSAYPKQDCTIMLSVGEEEDFNVITSYQTQNEMIKDDALDEISAENHNYNDGTYVIGIDLGTTTIAFQIYNTSKKQAQGTYSMINKQRAYGADVISRIQASTKGKGEELTNLIRMDLLEGIRKVIEQSGVQKQRLKQIGIAGNTTMGHLLLGYSCESLGAFPFTPINIGIIQRSFHELFQSDYLDIPVTLLPGISAFVGGDIVAGLLVCDFDHLDKPCMLIDLGTNGEMAIGNKDKILVSSTAAGPAFEGGNISCGIGSVAGAISRVTIKEEGACCETIGDKPPVGICGTGIIEVTSELLKNEFIDDTGLLIDSYFDEGYVLATQEDGNDTVGKKIIFTQKDIRELQMAKSAIRSGIEILVRSYGITHQDIDQVFLAGGFGYQVDVEKAIHIGLFPKEFLGKTKVIGNSSLAGAIQYLIADDAQSRIHKIQSVAEELHLANDKDFHEYYMDYMYLN